MARLFNETIDHDSASLQRQRHHHLDGVLVEAGQQTPPSQAFVGGHSDGSAAFLLCHDPGVLCKSFHPLEEPVVPF